MKLTKKIIKFNRAVKHTGHQKCFKCGYRSLSGFKKEKGLCRYHWSLYNGWIKDIQSIK